MERRVAGHLRHLIKGFPAIRRRDDSAKDSCLVQGDQHMWPFKCKLVTIEDQHLSHTGPFPWRQPWGYSD